MNKRINRLKIKRNEYETDLSYRSREIFLMTATDGKSNKITDELIQLSNIFVNVTILGCSYPSSVLKKVFTIANKINKKIYNINI